MPAPLVANPHMQRYRLYLDESGDHVMRDEATLMKERHRYLCLLGCWMPIDKYVAFQSELESLKRTHFSGDPDKPVILHRDDVVGCRGPFWRLRDVQARAAFDRDLLALFRDTDYVLFGAVVDKLAHKQRYACPHHPYHMALGFVLQRYAGFLNHFNRQGDVVAESRGSVEDQELARAFAEIWEHGDQFHAGDFYQRALTSREIKLRKKSANIAGLQLADLLANPVCRYVLLQERACDDSSTQFESQLFQILGDKFNRNVQTEDVRGYGWVLFPK